MSLLLMYICILPELLYIISIIFLFYHPLFLYVCSCCTLVEIVDRTAGSTVAKGAITAHGPWFVPHSRPTNSSISVTGAEESNTRGLGSADWYNGCPSLVII